MPNIIDAGNLIPCKKIIFEDGHADIENSHPGITLLPSDSEDDNIYFLYMTSSLKQFKRNKDHYLKFSFKKDSYINLKHILIEPNHHRETTQPIDKKTYLEILKNFYEYQSTKDNECFENIKNQIEVIIQILELEFKIDKIHSNPEEINITPLNLRILSKCNDPEIRKNIIVAKFISKFNNNKQSHVINDLEDNSLDRHFILQLNILKKDFEKYLHENSYIDNVDVKNPNTEYENLKNYYYDFMCTKSCLSNADKLLYNLLILSSLNETSKTLLSRINKIHDFLSNKSDLEKQNEIEQILNKIKNQDEIRLSRSFKKEIKQKLKKELKKNENCYPEI